MGVTRASMREVQRGVYQADGSTPSRLLLCLRPTAFVVHISDGGHLLYGFRWFPAPSLCVTAGQSCSVRSAKSVVVTSLENASLRDTSASRDMEKHHQDRPAAVCKWSLHVLEMLPRFGSMSLLHLPSPKLFQNVAIYVEIAEGTCSNRPSRLCKQTCMYRSEVFSCSATTTPELRDLLASFQSFPMQGCRREGQKVTRAPSRSLRHQPWHSAAPPRGAASAEPGAAEFDVLSA